MNLFETMYRCFVSFFGENLADHLSGWSCDEEAYINQNLYLPIGFIALGIALGFVILYYYVIGNMAIGSRLNKWWHWLLVFCVVAIINLFIGYSWTFNEIPNIGDCLLYSKDDNGNITSTLITEVNCWMFGLANSIISAGFFCILSLLGKWKSINCKKSPF